MVGTDRAVGSGQELALGREADRAVRGGGGLEGTALHEPRPHDDAGRESHHRNHEVPNHVVIVVGAPRPPRRDTIRRMDRRGRAVGPMRLAEMSPEALAGEVPADLLAAATGADRVIASVDDNGVVGLAASTHTRSGPELVTWWVHPERRGVGVGGTLLRSVLAAAGPDQVRVSADRARGIASILSDYGFEPGDDATRWCSPPGLIRQAARALVTDPSGRFVLVRCEFSSGSFWHLPGGGINPGETTRSALVRELDEELGITIGQSDVGPLAWHYLHWWTQYDAARFDGQLERVHSVAAPTDRFEPSIGWDGLLGEGVTDIAWWTLEDLASTAERFAWPELPAYIAAARTEAPPVGPVTPGLGPVRSVTR